MGSPRLPASEDHARRSTAHVELWMYWSPTNLKTTWALVDTVEECILINENLQKHKGQWTTIYRYGDSNASEDQTYLGGAQLSPREYTIYVSPLQETIVGVDVLLGNSVHSKIVQFHLGV
jgi:hypothetical protein